MPTETAPIEELREKYRRQMKELEELENRIFKLRNEMTVTSGKIEIALIRQGRRHDAR